MKKYEIPPINGHEMCKTQECLADEDCLILAKDAQRGLGIKCPVLGSHEKRWHYSRISACTVSKTIFYAPSRTIVTLLLKSLQTTELSVCIAVVNMSDVFCVERRDIGSRPG